MAHVMGSDRSRYSPFSADNGNQISHAKTASKTNTAFRDAKRLRMSSDVSISGQSDLVEAPTASLDHPHLGQPAGEVGGICGSDVQQPMESSPSDEEDSRMEEDPDWESIQQHEPARREVPIFLATREKREEASHRFAMAVDELHDSVSQSMEELVHAVSTLLVSRSQKLYDYEQSLKQDFAYNEKMRSSMQSKVEETARATKGFFANLLMRVAQPLESGANGMASSVGVEVAGDFGKQQENNGSVINRNDFGEEEPDWDTITKHEPAKLEVPIFLAARERREAADSRFASAIDDYQACMDNSFQELTQAVVDMYNDRSMKLNEYEQMLKQDFVSNDEMRASLRSKLEESATAAHNIFEALLRRVMPPSITGDSVRLMPQDAP